MTFANSTMCIGVFLNQVHQQLEAKYIQKKTTTTVVAKDLDAAKQLQSFLQELKARSDARAKSLGVERRGVDTNNVYNLLLQQAEDQEWEKLMEAINSQLSTAGFRTGINRLFRRTEHAGKTNNFERELGAVIAAVNDSALASAGVDTSSLDSYSPTQLGSERVSLSAVKDIPAALGNEMVRDAYTRLMTRWNNEIRTKKQSASMANLGHTASVSVQGKIDVNGKSPHAEIILSLSTSGKSLSAFQKRLRTVAKILQGATFTAKNYKSFRWDDQAKTYVPINNDAPWANKLHIGQSDPFRAIHGTLSSLGYGSAVTGIYFTKMVEALDGIKFSKKPYAHSFHSDIVSHINHLRFVYELTGGGQTYDKAVDLAFPEARYLIYNDPTTGNIYVRSTASIVVDYISSALKKKDSRVLNDAFFSAMSVAKASFN